MTNAATPAPLTFSFDAEHQLDLDAYLPLDPAAASGNQLTKVPVLVYFHGGGIVSGSKNDVLFPHWFKMSGPFPQPAGGNYPARAAATLPSVLPRPAGWFDSFGQGGDFLLEFWLTPQDVDVSMPFTLHGPERAAELLAQGGGPMVSDDPFEMGKEGKLVDKHFRWLLFVEAARDGTYLDLLFKEPGLSAKLAALPYAERLAAIPEEKRGWPLPITPVTTRCFVQHGTGDIVVPCDESRKLEKDMKALGLVDWIEGTSHAFLNLDPEGEEMKRLMDRSVVWIEKVLKEVK